MRVGITDYISADADFKNKDDIEQETITATLMRIPVWCSTRKNLFIGYLYERYIEAIELLVARL